MMKIHVIGLIFNQRTLFTMPTHQLTAHLSFTLFPILMIPEINASSIKALSDNR